MSRIFENRLVWLVISIILVLSIIWLLLFRLIIPGMWKFLVVDEMPEQSDVIIVLSGDTGRVEYGVELYQSGYADNILFAGGAAQSMKQQAISLGLNEGHILLDRKSHTTFENARNSAMIMEAQKLKSAIIVTSAYHTKRAGIIFSQFIPRSDLTICSVPDNSSAKDWWKDSYLATVVILEYLKLIWHYLFEK